MLILTATHWQEFRAEPPLPRERLRVRVNRVLLAKSLAVAGGMIAGFFAGWPVPVVALLAGALLLVTRRVKPEKIYREVDWPLLAMFMGLFIVVAGMEKAVLDQEAALIASRLRLDRPAVLTAAAAVLSNLVSNVPAVLVFKPLIGHLADPQRAWLVLAMASTFSGNLTLVGSVANLILVERASRQARISFLAYLRAGLPLALLTLALGAWMLR
jgi:Na+/H+ antiporter NhaD/arsenite permease-like protein